MSRKMSPQRFDVYVARREEDRIRSKKIRTARNNKRRRQEFESAGSL